MGIDLIDEAGSRPSSELQQQPSAIKELKRELRQATKDKEEAVKAQDFDQAGKLRDRELEIEAQLRVIAETKDEAKRSELPVVDVEDIARCLLDWSACQQAD